MIKTNKNSWISYLGVVIALIVLFVITKGIINFRKLKSDALLSEANKKIIEDKKAVNTTLLSKFAKIYGTRAQDILVFSAITTKYPYDAKEGVNSLKSNKYWYEKIKNRTDFSEDSKLSIKKHSDALSDLDEEMLKRFIDVANKSININWIDTNDSKCVIDGNLDANANLFQKERWVVFKAKYGKHSWIVETSDIGFNDDINQALVLVSVSKNERYGLLPYLHYLKKTGEKWNIVTSLLLK